MSHLVLARKYRPQTFEEVVQQEHITRTLAHAITSDRVAHAVLFAGPRGTGKTTVARILAKAMNCKEGRTPILCNSCRSCREITSGNAADVFEIDGASNNGVEQVRELRENVRYMPSHSPYKIYIIDEVHMLSTAAFNALLKTIEEPPSHILFIFATTEPNKIPITILSRCQRHDFRRIDLDAISKHMAEICSQEEVEISSETLALIAREAGGSMRDALSLLDQVVTCSEGTVIHEKVLDLIGVVDRKTIFDIAKAVLKGSIPDILDLIDDVYDRGHDIKKLYSDLIEHFRNLLVVKLTKRNRNLVDVSIQESALLKDQVEGISQTYLSQILDLLFKQESTIKYSTQPKLALEMAFIKILQLKPALSMDTLIEKLDTLKNSFHTIEPDPYDVDVSPALGNNIQQAQIAPVAASPELPSEKSLSETYIEGDVESVRMKLLEIINRKNPSLSGPMANSKIKELSDNTICFEINSGSFNINMVERKKSILQKICNDFFGKKMNLKIDGKINKTTNGKKQENDRNGRLKKEALNHPLVSDAIEIFNGKVVDVKLL